MFSFNATIRTHAHSAHVESTSACRRARPPGPSQKSPLPTCSRPAFIPLVPRFPPGFMPVSPRFYPPFSPPKFATAVPTPSYRLTAIFFSSSQAPMRRNLQKHPQTTIQEQQTLCPAERSQSKPPNEAKCSACTLKSPFLLLTAHLFLTKQSQRGSAVHRTTAQLVIPLTQTRPSTPKTHLATSLSPHTINTFASANYLHLRSSKGVSCFVRDGAKP